MCARKAARPRQTRVLVVDDHAIVRDGLTGLINLQTDMRVCGEASDVDDALRQVRSAKPDVVVVDISLGATNGITLIRDLRHRHKNTVVLVLTMHDDPVYVRRAFEAGAAGYVVKQEGIDAVLSAIRCVRSGRNYISPHLASALLMEFSPSARDSSNPDTDCLSPREFEVLHLIGQGLSPREIADSLHRSVKTIEAHRENIKKKLGLKTAADVVRFAAGLAREGGA